MLGFYCLARVAELVDALDLGSSGVTPVRVRVSPFALIVLKRLIIEVDYHEYHD
jgi:hypothetical protein